MHRPLRSAILGGAAVLALSMGAAVAAAQTPPDAPAAPPAATKAKTEKRVVIVRTVDGQTTTYDSARDGHLDFAGGSPPPMRPDHFGNAHFGPGEHMMFRIGHRDPEARAKHLRELLQLTPAQEPALQAFLTSMKPPERPEGPGAEIHRIVVAKGADGKVDTARLKEETAKLHADMEKHRAEMEKRRAEEAALTTPQKLDRMVKHMAEESAKRQSELQSHVDAVKRFYAALTPSQQKAFDALHGPGMGPGMGGMHGGFMRHGEEGPMRMHMAMAPMPPLPPEPPAPPPPPPPPGDR